LLAIDIGTKFLFAKIAEKVWGREPERKEKGRWGDANGFLWLTPGSRLLPKLKKPGIPRLYMD